MFRTLTRTSLLVAALAAAAASAGAQTWTSLDGSAPGTPADVVLDEVASTSTDFVFDVFVHGFFTETVAPGDGFSYERVRVPGLDRLGQTGAPDLPVARLDLAVSSGALEVQLTSANVLASQAFVLLPYPFVVQETDEAFDPTFDPGPGDPSGNPEVFVKDAAIYGGVTAFPAESATPLAPVSPWLDSIPAAAVEIRPASWDPTTGVLTVAEHLRVHFSTAGSPGPFPAMTADRAALAAATFDNWPEQSSLFPVDATGFAGDYLIVTPEEYLVPLQPFVEHKQGHGFDVELLTLESLAFVSCGEIRGAIDSWYQGGDVWSDRYVLLVGDADVLPPCPSPTLGPVPGDDLYGSPSDGDLDEEVFVGRLSVDDADDLADQIARILAYDRTTTAPSFDEALLVAHAQDAPGKYEGAHESVANASYAVAPTFEKAYGSQGATNADVDQAIEGGVGVVAYRGHGTTSTWSNWNGVEDFHNNDVLGLDSTQPFVVWSFGCWNSNVEYSPATQVDSLGEVWLEGPGGSAAAHYGSTDLAGTEQNHELDRRMFEAVFEQGLTRHGQAIAWAEAKAADTEPGQNPWTYMLLGDPSMRVRRTDPEPLTLSMPTEIPVCAPGGGPCTFDVTVTNSLGDPVAGALVSAVQAGGPGEPPIFQAETITDSSGVATLPGPLTIQVVIQVTTSDPNGNEADGVLGVVSGAWTTFGGAVAGAQGKPELVGDGPLTANTIANLDMVDGAGQAAAALFVSLSSNPVPFKCGMLQAFPFAIPPIFLPTDAQGEVHLAFAWPGGIPSDVEFWFQLAIQDEAAPCGVSLSNAVRATTP